MKLLNSASIEFLEDKGGKGRKFQSRFIEQGLCSYKGNGGKVILVKKETLDKFINTMIGVPVIINHQDVTDDNVKEVGVGFVSDVWFNSDDGWYYCSGIIQGNDAEVLIDERGYSVSCGYTVKEKNTDGGIWHDIEYDEEVLDGSFDHLAIVSNPRYRDATILLNETDIKEEKEKMFKLFNSKTKRNESEETEMDKRKEISEVEAILYDVKDGKEKLTEEIIKTIVGKMEKDAYENESEEETKECESEEDDKKENSEEEIESEDKKEKKSEEDKKENSDEEEKEEKEEEDKKENSSSFKKLESLSNSVKSEEITSYKYETETDRLNRGKNY